MISKRTGIPVLGFAAFSGAGKTTLLEKLIPKLKKKGLAIAVVKHDSHGLAFDREGKDSWRFSHAGADYSVVSGPGQSAVFIGRSLQPEEAFRFISDADLILVEGYKEEAFSQIGISRKATGKGFTADIESFAAIVTDEEVPEESGVPIFALDDLDGIAEFIICNLDNFSRYNNYDV
ncbi:MAG: molybdopterin-guanine dinucleotide biosynthesis protein B [Lachnospiraceae bacterium]|jgi:molybdopterin-guanine dinucleotide biosynthesis protein MobB